METKIMKKVLIVIMLLVLLVGYLPAAERLSSNCAFFLKAQRIEAFARHLVEYAALFGARITAQQILSMVSLKLFGRIGFPGMHLKRPVRLYLYKFKDKRQHPSDARAHLLLALPLSDANLFKEVVAPVLKERKLRCRYKGDTAFAFSSFRAYAEYNHGAKGKARLLQGGQFTVSINTKLFRKEIRKGLAAVGSRAGRFSSLLKSLMSIYIRLLHDISSADYGINLDRHGFEIAVAMGLVPESGLAALCQANRPDRLRPLAVLPADSILAAAGKMPMRKGAKYFNTLLEPLRRLMPGFEKIFDEVFQYLGENSTGARALAMLPARGIGFSFASVGGVRSAPAARSFYRRLSALVNRLSAIHKLRVRGLYIKVVYSEGAELLSGKSVDVFRLGFESARPLPKRALATVKMIKRLLSGRVVYTEGYELVAFGEDSRRRLQEMIRNSRGYSQGFKSSAAYRKVNRRYGRYAKNSFFYLSLKGFAREMRETLLSGDSQSARFLRKLRVSGSVYGYGCSSSQGIRLKMLIDRDAILGIKNLVQYFIARREAERQKHGRERPLGKSR